MILWSWWDQNLNESHLSNWFQLIKIGSIGPRPTQLVQHNWFNRWFNRWFTEVLAWDGLAQCVDHLRSSLESWSCQELRGVQRSRGYMLDICHIYVIYIYSIITLYIGYLRWYDWKLRYSEYSWSLFLSFAVFSDDSKLEEILLIPWKQYSWWWFFQVCLTVEARVYQYIHIYLY